MLIFDILYNKSLLPYINRVKAHNLFVIGHKN